LSFSTLYFQCFIFDALLLITKHIKYFFLNITTLSRRIVKYSLEASNIAFRKAHITINYSRSHTANITKNNLRLDRRLKGRVGKKINYKRFKL